MEKSQFDLFAEVLHRLNAAGLLKYIVLVGSWCMLAYKDYFTGSDYVPSIKTRDLDLFVPRPAAITQKVNVAELLKDLGFIVGFAGPEGYIRLEHPALIIEFLVPERGKGLDKPYPLPKLGVNAQSLRYLDVLSQNTLDVNIGLVKVTVPHPANFALHKLLITSKRPTEEKKSKDMEAAVKILEHLIKRDERNVIRTVFQSLPPRWQRKIKQTLININEDGILSKFE